MRWFSLFALSLLINCNGSGKSSAALEDLGPSDSLSPDLGKASSAPPKNYHKIIVIGSALTELVIALGDSNKIIATDRSHPRYPHMDLPRVGYEATLRPDYLIQQGPDLVLSDTEGSPSAIIEEVKKKPGIDYVTFTSPNTIESLKSWVSDVGQFLQREAEAKNLIADIEKNMNKVQALLDDRKDSSSVVYIHAAGVETLLAAGANTPMDAIIRVSGAKNAFEEFIDLQRINPEDMLYYNPIFILMNQSSGKRLYGKMYNSPVLLNSHAYRMGRLIILPDYELNYVGIYTPQTAITLAEKYYTPTYFAPLPSAPPEEVPSDRSKVSKEEIVQ